MKVNITFGLILSLAFATIAQSQEKFNYSKISAFCLDADIASALKLIQTSDLTNLSKRDSNFVVEIRNRFGHSEDMSKYRETRKSKLDDILLIYMNYWRESLLDPKTSYDSILRRELSYHLTGSNSTVHEDSLHLLLIKRINDLGYHTTGFGMTGKLYDLLVWRSQQDTTYRFNLHHEIIECPVVLMDDFITLGWEEYATADRAYPGGWATATSLYCVKKGYKLSSEEFLISYLCHEGKHFSDLKQFPNLSSTELEYRAKLTELSLLNGTLFKVLANFIRNSNETGNNPHTVANFQVIRDLSVKMFREPFVEDIKLWEQRGIKKINKAAYEILRKNIPEKTKN